MPNDQTPQANRFRFRAWHPVAKTMHPVTGWYFFEGRDLLHISVDSAEGELQHMPARDFILMQSTGLTDKNGKEQFASDIVRAKSNQTKKIVVGVIEWRDKEAAFRLVVPGDYCYRLDDVHNVEVIGNIHEHSHLIPTPL